MKKMKSLKWSFASSVGEFYMGFLSRFMGSIRTVLVLASGVLGVVTESSRKTRLKGASSVGGAPSGSSSRMLRLTSIAMIVSISILVWTGNSQVVMEEALEVTAMSDRLYTSGRLDNGHKKC